MSTVGKLILQRLLSALFVLWVVSLIIFLGVSFLPGDIATQMLGQSALPSTLAAFRHQLGLDLPLHVRYMEWLGGILHGDFGRSLANGQEVSSLIMARLGNTLFLAGITACIAVPVSLILGLLAALYRSSIFDRAVNVVALTWMSFPEFFIAYVLILFLAVKVSWFPSLSTLNSGDTLWAHLYVIVLPATTLSLVVIGHMMRMTRATIISVLASPYVEMARLKGASRASIVVRHALPNALAPIVNVIVVDLAYLIVGVVVVEVVFVYPGIGDLMVASVQRRDIPIVQACSLIFAITYILLNLIADIVSIVSNPRHLYPK